MNRESLKPEVTALRELYESDDVEETANYLRQIYHEAWHSHGLLDETKLLEKMLEEIEIGCVERAEHYLDMLDWRIRLS